MAPQVSIHISDITFSIVTNIHLRWITDVVSLERHRDTSINLLARAIAPFANFEELVIVGKWCCWVCSLERVDTI